MSLPCIGRPRRPSIIRVLFQRKMRDELYRRRRIESLQHFLNRGGMKSLGISFAVTQKRFLATECVIRRAI